MSAVLKRDFRQEAAAPLDGLTDLMRACLLELHHGPLVRSKQGYTGRTALSYPVRTVDKLIDRGLLRQMLVFGTGGKQRQIWPTGEGAWTIRTLQRCGR